MKKRILSGKGEPPEGDGPHVSLQRLSADLRLANERLEAEIAERRRAEQAATQDNIFSNTLIASQPDVFYVLDATGRFIRWNDRMRDVLGISDAQIADATALEYVNAADRPSVARKIQEAFEQGGATIDARILSAAGIREYRMTATRAITAKGALLVGVGTDITERKHDEQRLRQSEAQLAESQRIAQVGSWESDHATGAGIWSAETFRIFEEDPAAFTPSFEAFRAAVHPGDRAALEQEIQRSFREHTPFEIEHRLLMKDGRVKHVHERGETVLDGQGRPLRTVGTVQDVTTRVQAERQARIFRALIDGAPDGIQVVDPETLRILDVNESACVKLGYTREELLALHVADIDTGDSETHRAITERLRKDGKATFESCQKRKDGVTFPVEVTAQILVLDRPYSLGIARDISERRCAEAEVRKLHEQLREQALHDPLTGLYNRRYLDETMVRELIRAARYDLPVGVIMCDIDHFKAVNDTYGHQVGDEVLRAFAELLGAGSRGSDIVCRYGGEEFLLLLPDVPPAVAQKRAEQLRAALEAKPITSGAAVVQVTASFGVASFPEDGTTADELVRAADDAMYRAKRDGRNRVLSAARICAG